MNKKAQIFNMMGLAIALMEADTYGYPIDSGYIGHLADGRKMEFATEEDYKEYLGGDENDD